MIILELAETTKEVKATPPTIQEQGDKRIAIPRKKPTKVLRKPVFSYDPRRTEKALMYTAMVLFNSLGVFLYRLVHYFIITFKVYVSPLE